MQTPDQVERNYDAFVEMLPELMKSRPGQYALIHDEKIIDFFKESLAAVSTGLRDFGSGNYSVQQVTMEADDLGFYSYAGSSMQA